MRVTIFYPEERAAAGPWNEEGGGWREEGEKDSRGRRERLGKKSKRQ